MNRIKMKFQVLNFSIFNVQWSMHTFIKAKSNSSCLEPLNGSKGSLDVGTAGWFAFVDKVGGFEWNNRSTSIGAWALAWLNVTATQQTTIYFEMKQLTLTNNKNQKILSSIQFITYQKQQPIYSSSTRWNGNGTNTQNKLNDLNYLVSGQGQMSLFFSLSFLVGRCLRLNLNIHIHIDVKWSALLKISL